MENDIFIIPIDNYIEEFRTHLESHPRTIFSAKFGDGKSYFLNKIQEHEVFKDYTFLTIHPINYQVESNKDIFELVKRDILLQMIANNMIDDCYEIPDSVAIQFFVQNNISTVAEFFISSLGKLNADSKLYTAITAGYSTYNFIGKLKAKLKEYKIKGSDEEYMERFFTETSKLPSIEYDAISQIISHNIKKYQEENNKKVVIIFEDMDRIDPAHLFRILNVLSAQMDLPYITKENPNDTLNKYGFDNIVLVLDYGNLIKIFRHFYGPRTDFVGYISKFCPRGKFYYSLKEVRNNYIYEHIDKKILLDSEEQIREIITPKFLDSLNIRRIIESFNYIDEQISSNAHVKVNENIEVIAGRDILRLLVVLKRLGMDNEKIENYLKEKCKTEIMFLKFFNFYLSKNLEIKQYFRLNVPEYKEKIIHYKGTNNGSLIDIDRGVADIVVNEKNIDSKEQIKEINIEDIVKSIYDFVSQ